MRRRRALVSWLALALGLAAGSVPASAQDSATCVRLQAQLAGLQAGPRTAAADQQRAAAAYDRQAEQYRQLYFRAQQAGCLSGGRLLFLQQQRPGVCQGMIARLNQAQAQLQRLDSQRRQYAFDPGAANGQRRGILAALAANQCGPQYASARRAPDLLDSLFGEPRPAPDGWNDGSGYQEPQSTFSTLCVRSCDGYYFPISFATVPSHFAADEAACQSMCPGTDVALYTYRNPGEDVADAETLAGRRYTELPAAFAYRSAYNAGCTCHWPEAPAAASADSRPPATAVPIVPVPRPSPSADPETVADGAGGLAPAPVSRDRQAVAGLTPERAVRRVGPSYYYAQ